MAHYNRAPITEALIDLQVTPTAELDIAALEVVHVAEGQRYLPVPPRHSYHVRVRYIDQGRGKPLSMNWDWDG